MSRGGIVARSAIRNPYPRCTGSHGDGSRAIRGPVCTENLNPEEVVMKSAQDGK